jgi:hypothetical protein
MLRRDNWCSGLGSPVLAMNTSRRWEELYMSVPLLSAPGHFAKIARSPFLLERSPRQPDA